MIQHPYYPIVYIRGYAGDQAGVEATVATPYMGFNVGSTKIRQAWDGKTDRHIFESPLIRLGKDHGYRDVYERGDVITEDEDVPVKSIWIFRYYDQVSEEMSPDPNRPEMETYAEQLSDFLDEIRDLVCGKADGENADVTQQRAAFRVYLVAHSMGGLIARTYLQSVVPAKADRVVVDKVFTYGTPHRGIDLKFVGNLLTHLPFNNAENFNRGRMREYLALSGDDVDVNSLDGKFPPERFFCFIGTNHRDYGLPRHAVGAMSDGLVRIKNAYVAGAPRAFAHRAHSGDYGIVNSEEGYQNLQRFLFGDNRIDVLVDIESVTLPPDIWSVKEEGKEIEASYHFEVVTKVRGTRWDLHRRTLEEESALFISYKRIQEGGPITLASTFLRNDARVNKSDESMGFSFDFGVRVPDYRVSGFLWMDNHYEGGYVFRDKFNFNLTRGNPPKVRYGRDSRTTNRATTPLEGKRTPEGGWEYRIPIDDVSHPMLIGALVIRSSPWNQAE